MSVLWQSRPCGDVAWICVRAKSEIADGAVTRSRSVARRRSRLRLGTRLSLIESGHAAGSSHTIVPDATEATGDARRRVLAGQGRARLSAPSLVHAVGPFHKGALYEATHALCWGYGAVSGNAGLSIGHGAAHDRRLTIGGRRATTGRRSKSLCIKRREGGP